MKRTAELSLAQLIEYIPLQQGLRLFNDYFIKVITALIEYIPLQQGLRQPFHNGENYPIRLIEYIPLQQGLRLLYFLKCFILIPH